MSLFDGILAAEGRPSSKNGKNEPEYVPFESVERFLIEDETYTGINSAGKNWFIKTEFL